MLTLKNVFRSSPLDMFYSKHYTFDFFREKIRFFFVDFFLSGKKNCFFCEKNLGEKKSENFSAKKKIKFFSEQKSKAYTLE